MFLLGIAVFSTRIVFLQEALLAIVMMAVFLSGVNISKAFYPDSYLTELMNVLLKSSLPLSFSLLFYIQSYLKIFY